MGTLVEFGLPEEELVQGQWGLIAFAQENKHLLPQLVSAILPSDKDVFDTLKALESSGIPKGVSLEDQYDESMVWLQWLMFKEDPHNFLANLAKQGFGLRGVCGVVWGQKDIAYRCRTCEHDPTCAICVPCFQNGNHKDHDYSIGYTGAGCCDCGDVTAWKREGFCSKHKGTEQIQPLPEEVASSVGPVLDALFICWKKTLMAAEAALRVNSGENNCNDVRGKAANTFVSVIVEMLLSFCNYSESLLALVSERTLLLVGLLDVLMRAERFLNKKVVKKLHELLLKLLGEPTFKYAFAKAFISYYPTIVNEVIKEGKDSAFEKYQLVSTFSVQIFTVPTLTPRLVRELNLLGILLGSLGELFLSCAGEGCLQVIKWGNLYDTTICLVEDIRYVMSHAEVCKYVIEELPDISRAWLRLLTLVQGMDPQKRITSLHVEEEDDNIHTPLVLCHCIGNIHSLLVAGAFSADDNEEIQHNGIAHLDDSDTRHTQVGWLSQESSICSTTSRSSLPDCSSQISDGRFDIGNASIPSSAIRLINECLRALGSWLVTVAAPRRLSSSLSLCNNTLALKKSISKIKRIKKFMRAHTSASSSGTDSAVGRSSTGNEFFGKLNYSSPMYYGGCINANLESEGGEVAQDMDCESVEQDSAIEIDSLRILTMKDWPEIMYDVRSQDVSFHIPLHRFLSLLLQKTLRSYGESGLTNIVSGVSLSGCVNNFFGQDLGGCHPHGFSASVMEHPLRLRVFCAQVRAGMWRKNGDAAIFSCEWYGSVRWWDQGLEFDLFLLQCCAALAPPDLYVQRIQERFELSNYQFLNPERPNEYEPILMQEMLTLIIQIVKERRFCGLSTVENLRRELVYKLAIGDATHSQLVKALPSDLSKSDQLPKNVDTLAVYSNPSGMKQGKYSLRTAYWKELDLYHPRWNSRDLQIAEERFLRFCKVSALTVQLPRWTKIFYPLNTVYRIATCKMVLQLVRTVLFYAVFSNKSSVSRTPVGVLLTALHLLSLALDICSFHRSSTNACDGEDSFPILTYASEKIDVGTTNGVDVWKHESMLSLLVLVMRKYKKEIEQNLVEATQCNFSALIVNLLRKLAELDTGCMTELQRLAPDVVGSLTQQPPSIGIQNSVPASDAEERRAKIRERQDAILEKMKAEQAKFVASLNSTSNTELDLHNDVSYPDADHVSEDASSIICSLCRDPDSRDPLSFLIHLQAYQLC